LGTGNRTQTTTATAVLTLGGMAALAAGGQHGLATAIRTMTTAYTYDHLNELTATSGAGQRATSYGYDPVGNRTSEVQGASSAASTVDRADRLTSVGGLAATSDAAGNLTGLSGSGLAESFAYDQANRLTGATINGATTTDAYDGDGLRVGQTSGGTTTTYVNDVNRSLPVVLSDGARTYVYGLGLAYSVDSSNTLQVYHTDGLGSVRALTDGSGNVIQTYQTDAFGNPLSTPGTQGAAGQPFGFTGQQQDPTGLVYLRARSYFPALGRFMTRDPVAGNPADPLSLNRYSYVRNDPTTLTDPSGTTPTNKALRGGDASDTCANLDPFRKLFCSILNPIPLPGGGMAMAPGGFGGQGDLGGDLGDPPITFTDKKLQSQLAQHGADFGITGPNNAAARAAFRQAIVKHVTSPDTTRIVGSYRGQPAIHYVNPQTGLDVFTKPNGEFWGGWQLNPGQLTNVLARGSL
jgi:RHS repeat-associated protein